MSNAMSPVLCVVNIPRTNTCDDIYEYFMSIGSIKNLAIMVNNDVQKVPTGTVYVQFDKARTAENFFSNIAQYPVNDVYLYAKESQLPCDYNSYAENSSGPYVAIPESLTDDPEIFEQFRPCKYKATQEVSVGYTAACTAFGQKRSYIPHPRYRYT